MPEKHKKYLCSTKITIKTDLLFLMVSDVMSFSRLHILCSYKPKVKAKEIRVGKRKGK